MNGKVRRDNNTVERCIHCGAELKTWQEVNDQMCNSCANALACDEGDYIENLKNASDDKNEN